jgi:hypothetical protein
VAASFDDRQSILQPAEENNEIVFLVALVLGPLAILEVLLFVHLPVDAHKRLV